MDGVNLQHLHWQAAQSLTKSLNTGGSKPYGYAGYGELFVFVFFGLVAVAGTSASQTGQVTVLALLGGVACGAFSTAILVANNLRDIPTDQLSGKRTLAGFIGMGIVLIPWSWMLWQRR